jgi:hypothetical protein
MKTLRLLCHAAAFAVVLMLGTSLAHAQATRTWVSGVGDDANPCSRTAPCKTFAGAISKTAPFGEIDCLDPGGFGAVTITKSITLNCGDGDGGYSGSVLVNGTNGIVISAAGTDRVTLRNIGFQGLQNLGLAAILFNSGAYLHVQSVEIIGFQNGISVNNGGFNITTVRNSVISDSSMAGANIVCPGFCAFTLDNVQVSNAATGVHAGANATVSIQRSTLIGPTSGTSTGVLADAANSIANLDNCTVGFWTTGVNAPTGGNAHVSNSTILNNGTGVNNNVGTTSPGTNRFFNNTVNGGFGAGATTLL